MTEVVENLLIVAAFSFAGVLLTRAMMPKPPRGLLAALAYPIGAGTCTWVFFLLSWVGVRLTPVSVVGAGAAVMIAAGTAAGLRGASATDTERAPADKPRLDIISLGAGGVLLGATALLAVISVGLSYYWWDDAAIWGVKGYGIALEGSVFSAARWGAYNLSYPLNIPLQVATFCIFGGDTLPGSKLIGPAYFFSLGALVLHHLRARGVRPSIVALAVLAIATMPVVFEHATTGYANLPFSVYLVSGLVCLTTPGMRDREGSGLLGGLALGLAVWTRPEGVVMVAGCALVVLVSRSSMATDRSEHGWAWLVSALIVGVPWLLFRGLFAQGSTVTDAEWRAISSLLSGDVRWSAIVTILRYVAGQVLRFRAWGVMALVDCVILGADISTQRGNIVSRLREPILLAALTLGLAVVAIYFGIAYSGDLYVWMDTGLNRVMMPSMILLTLSAMLSLDRMLSSAAHRR